MRVRRGIWILFSIAVLTAGTIVWPQATAGTISGHISDPSGKAIRGATVSIRDAETGGVTAATTNDAGEFTQTSLRPDHYSISVEATGFETASVPAFALDIDQKARFNIAMKIGAASTDVEVTDSAPILQMQGAATGQVIGTREITDLPLEGRDFTGLMLLVPGVGTGGGGNNLNLSVNGQREFSNSVQVNGVEVTGNRNNDTNVIPGPDALQEFKMVTSTYAPEFGRASGGSVLLQTKSGSNDYHGSAYFFYRPTATAANNPFSAVGTTPALQQKIYGATIGGANQERQGVFFPGIRGQPTAECLFVPGKHSTGQSGHL